MAACRAIQHDKDKVRLIAIFLHNYACSEQDIKDLCKLFNQDKFPEGREILQSIPKMYANAGKADEKEGRITPYLSPDEVALYQ